MAMEKAYMISETHSRAVTAIGFHPIRREIVVGFEDGVMKWWEQDTGKLMQTNSEHTGWLTDFRYWAEQKTLFSSGHDGLVIAWGSGGNALERISFGFPIYVMSLNLRRQQIIFGLNSSVHVYSLDQSRSSGHLIDNRSKPFVARDHNDLVPCIICHESRVYTGGYDAKFCIYDTTLYPGTLGLDLIYRNNRAHAAGINCMILVKDNENNKWLLTGSFDRSVKVWSQDGQLRQKIETVFLDTITSMCYLPRAKTVWIASAERYPTLFDPKAGENVTEFLPTFQEGADDENAFYDKLLKLQHNPDSGQLVGCTNRRQLIVWRYNGAGCITALKCKSAIESMCYTRKVPLLLFSGGTDGIVYKWERLQSSHFMYSMELMTRKEAVDKLEAIKKERGLGRKRPRCETARGAGHHPSTRYAFNRGLVDPASLYHSTNIALLSSVYVEDLDVLAVASEDGNIYLWGFDYAAVDALTQLATTENAGDVHDNKYTILTSGDKLSISEPHRGANGIPRRRPSDDQSVPGTRRPSDAVPCTNGAAHKAGHRKSSVDECSTSNSAAIMPDTPRSGDGGVAPAAGVDSVTNRVAGYICKNVLMGHNNCVSALAVVQNPEQFPTTYLLSGGWDRRILLWNLEEGVFQDQLRRKGSLASQISSDGSVEDSGEVAADGVVICMEYCAKRNEFAYASSDGMVYIRQFSENGTEWELLNTLQGHELEITGIRWNPVYDNWVTSSEDGTIKIWSEDGMTCEKTLATQGAVSTFCVDRINGSIVAAVESVIKVYDLETSNLVQTNIGHSENIRCLIHVVERSQYMSGAWDKTIRIWNAYRRPHRRTYKKKLSAGAD